MKDEERDLIRKIILEMVQKGHIHWTDLKKKVLGTCHPFATDTTFANQMRYLQRKGLTQKKTRGVYIITDKGKQYLKIMS